MKKLLLVTLVFISLNTRAQSPTIGFTSGVAIANYKAKVDGSNESANSKAGFTVGVLLDVPVGKYFSFQPALNFVQKGMKEKQSILGYTMKYKMNVNEIEIPLNFLYNSRGKNVNLFVGAGPSVAFALNGKFNYSDGTDSKSENVKFGTGDEDMMKGIDIGANFIAGVSLNNGILVSCNYNAGLNNLFPGGGGDNGSLKSHYLGIKLGYMLNFGKRK
jgi:hypothetical protein